MTSIIDLKRFKTVKTKKYKMYSELSVACEFIYTALQDPQSSEVAKYFDQFLDKNNKTINLVLLDKTLEKILTPSISYNSKMKYITQQGGTVNSCIAVLLTILIISLSLYISGIYAENVHYELHCAKYSDIINPNSPKSLINSLYKIYKMSRNKYEIEYCKSIDKNRNQIIYSLAESGYALTKDFMTILKTSGSIILFLLMLFSKGIEGLICLTAKYLDIEELCGIDCTKIKSKKNKKPASDNSSSQQEE